MESENNPDKDVMLGRLKEIGNYNKKYKNQLVHSISTYNKLN
jgi:hypothetical protein